MTVAYSSPGSFPRSRRRILLLALLACAFGTSRAQQATAAERLVRDLLQTHDKWLFAFTSRLPLDPIESWNQLTATINRDGDGLTIGLLSPDKGIFSFYPLTIQADGFAFEYTGYGQIFMRLDSADSKAPFKGQVNDRTYWLLRGQRS